MDGGETTAWLILAGPGGRMSGLRAELLDWFEAGRVAPGREDEALREAGILPSREKWHDFVGQFCLWLGTLALAAAVIFFFAFNWDDLGRFAKFALVEALIVAGLAACWWLDLDAMPGKAVLTALSLLTGALLALTGQVYQTGADPYELFGWWAVLILPWVIVARFSPLWLIWLALGNLTILLYPQRAVDGEAMFWALFAFNTLALIAWEAAHRAGTRWLRDSWPPRLIAIAGGVAATGLASWAVTGPFETRSLANLLAYAAWLAAIHHWYRRQRFDLFMLAGALFSLIVTVTMFLGDNVLGDNSVGFLVVGLVVIGMSAGGAIWLKAVARAQSQAETA
jgi:uncharacterized membrane protein